MIGIAPYDHLPPDHQFPDGVYLNLPEPRYFCQGLGAKTAKGSILGTTDLSALWLRKHGWWWKSRNNPFYRPGSTEAKTFGSATHALLLEGLEAFEARFAVEPNPKDYPDLLVSTDDLMSALEGAGAPMPNSRAKKQEFVDLAKAYLPDRHVWDLILERFTRTAGKREVISFEERWKLQVMLDACMADPDMNAVVTAGRGVRLNEVSVFWTLEDGIRLRFRFDTLLPPMVADLKTMRGGTNDDLATAIGKTIGLGALDVQAAMSFEARRMTYRFIEAGQVYGGTDEQNAWLARFPAEAPLDLGDRPGWAWLWMFYLKADASGTAPTILPLRMDFGSAQHRDGLRKAMHALAFYRQQVATVGLTTPWTRVEPVHTMREADPLRVTIPHWIEAPMAIAGEERSLSWRS